MRTTGFKSIIFLFKVVIASSVFFGCADYDYGDPEPPEPPAAVILSVNSVTDSSVTLSWTKCSNDSFKGYIILYNAGENIVSQAKASDTLPFSIDTIFTVKSLIESAAYSFRVMVILKNGLSTPSYHVTTKTLKRMKGILNFWYEIKNSDIYFTWTKSVTSCSMYKIFSDSLSTVDTSKKNIGGTQYRESDTTFTYKDHTPGSKLFYRVYAINDLDSIVAKSGPVMVELPKSGL